MEALKKKLEEMAAAAKKMQEAGVVRFYSSVEENLKGAEFSLSVGSLRAAKGQAVRAAEYLYGRFSPEYAAVEAVEV